MMMKRNGLAWLVLLVTMLGLAACGGSPAAEAQDDPAGELPPVSDREWVTAEAVIEPQRWSELRFQTGGLVAEVLVTEGDEVAAGAPLVRLDTRELELSLESARQELVAAQAALDQLVDGASETVIARAARDNAQQVAQAEVILRIKQLQLAQARLQDPDAQARTAEAQVRQLELQVAQARAQSQAPSITAAQADLERAQIALDETQVEYKKALDRPWEPQEVRDGWAKMLRQAELSYQQAQAQLAGAQNGAYAQSLGADALAVQLEAAQAQLAYAIATQESYTLTLETLAAEVDTAELQLDALRAWENPYLDPATDQQLVQAEVALRQSEIAVARLELQLEHAELTAPFAGTIVSLDLKPGDMADPAAAVAVLATLDQLCARTLNLTEHAVAQVAEGRPAVVTVDALPDDEFSGAIRQVGLRGGDYRGDVVYTVMVDLDEAAGASLRWGMKSLVKIRVQD